MPSTLAIAAWLPKSLATALMAGMDMLQCSTAKSQRQATLNRNVFSVVRVKVPDAEKDAERENLRLLLGDREKKAFAVEVDLPGGPSMLSQHLSALRISMWIPSLRVIV